MDKLIRLMTDTFPIPSVIQQDILPKIQKQAYKSHTIIAKQGDYDPYLRIIERGALMGYTIDNTKKQHIYWIATEGQYVFSPQEFLSDTISIENIQTLEATHLYIMLKSDWRELCATHTELKALNDYLVEKFILEKHQWEQVMRLKLPEERIAQLYQTYPQMRSRIPQKHLANWLQIYESTFCRALKRAIKKKLL